jgi:hypothetical protein
MGICETTGFNTTTRMSRKTPARSVEMRVRAPAFDVDHGLPDPQQRADAHERLAMYAAAAEQRCQNLRAKLEAAESMVELLSKEARRRSAKSRL